MKKTILVIFGGNSNEHEVSLRSATTILTNIDTEKYYVLSLGITRDGRWLMYNGSPENIVTGEWEKMGIPAVLSPDTSHRGIMKLVGNTFKLITVDLCFPVLHGKNGEDGTIQGLFELAGIPFVGAGTLSSAVCMEKAIAKSVCSDLGIPQTKYLIYSKAETDGFEALYKDVKRELGFPCFVKPSAAGSSVGVTKAANKKELKTSVQTALEVDSTIVIEKAVKGRELEVAVLGNDEPVAAGPGEIVADREFYDYDSKYAAESATRTDASPVLPTGKAKEIRDMAINVYKALHCRGMARVDFFLDTDNNVIFSEVNTIPGFTSISMYPMLMRNEGVSVRELIDRLIAYGLS